MSTRNTHLMLDFETLGTTPDSVVVSLGAVLFTRDQVLGERQWFFNLNDQSRFKRRIDPETIAWWLSQPEEARREFTKTIEGRGDTLEIFTRDFRAWLVGVTLRELRVWSNGAGFDVPILENILGSQGYSAPWKFWNVRCYRTVKALYQIEKGFTNPSKHDSLADAKFQATCLAMFLQANSQLDR